MGKTTKWCGSGRRSALYCLPNIIRTIESRVRWVGNVAQILSREVHIGFWYGNLRESDHLEDLGIDKRIILRWIFRKWDVRGMDWMELAKDRDGWRAFMNAVIILRVP